MRAFIIEDDYLISQALADMLTELGFSKFGFARSEDAAIVGASGGEKIDLITADAKLLPGDGLKAVEVICKHHKIPVIFVTGYADELKDRLVSGHADATILTKPIKKDELAAAVRRVLPPRQVGLMFRSLRIRRAVLENLVAEMLASGRTDEAAAAALHEAWLELARIDEELGREGPPRHELFEWIDPSAGRILTAFAALD